MAGFLGSGDVYIDRLNDDGSSAGGLVRMGNATLFSLEPRTETRERTSRGRDTYGQVQDSVSLAQPSILRVTFDEVDRDNLALALMGTIAPLNRAAAVIAAEPVTAREGRFVRLAHGNVAEAGFAVTRAAGGGAAYVLGTDYDVNWRLGMLRALASGAIPDGEALLVAYTAQAVTGDRIEGQTRAQIKAHLMLDGRNQVDGASVVVDVPQAVLSPSSAFDFLADDFATLELQGSAVTPAGAAAPFTVEIRR